MKRPPLGDVSNLQPPHPAVSGNTDTNAAKRQRLSNGLELNAGSSMSVGPGPGMAFGGDSQSDINNLPTTAMAVTTSDGKENVVVNPTPQVLNVKDGTEVTAAVAPAPLTMTMT